MKSIAERQDMIQDIFKDCIKKISESKTKYPLNIDNIKLTVGYFTKPRNSLGLCRHWMQGCNLILLNELLLDIVEKNPEVIQSVLMHELIHTFEGCHNHRHLFQMYALRMSKEFHMQIQTHASKNDSEFFTKELAKKAPYIVVCMSCGKQITFARKSKLVTELIENKYSGFYHPQCKMLRTPDKSQFILTRYRGRDIDLSKNVFVAKNVDEKLLKTYLKKINIPNENEKLVADSIPKTIAHSTMCKTNSKKNKQLSLF